MNGIGIFKASRVSLRVPLLVALLMIVISVAISDRVLSRLSEMQESNLQGLVDSAKRRWF